MKNILDITRPFEAAYAAVLSNSCDKNSMGYALPDT
jgi:hypothetical protein